MNIEQQLKEHFQQDLKNFNRIDEVLMKDHKKFDEKLDKIQDSMDAISWLSDASKGVSLLKRPIVWILGLIIGIIALTGGLKAMILAILSIIGVKPNV